MTVNGGLPIKVGFENQTSFPSRGELLFYPGFISEKELRATVPAVLISGHKWPPATGAITWAYWELLFQQQVEIRDVVWTNPRRLLREVGHEAASP